MHKIITIIGGAGLMGKLFTHYWQSQGNTVHSIDQHDWENAPSIINKSDLVIVSVPINHTQNIIKQIAAYLSKTTVLADFTSIKTIPLNLMLEVHSGPVLGLHPMFGPTISTPHNQVIINCGGRGDYQWVLDSLSSIGFTISNMSADSHDQAMSFIQGIEHFSTFVLGTFLRHHEQHPSKLFNLASPIYQAKLALMGRIFDQDANLYADIITADQNRINLIDEYAKYFQEWVKKLNHPNDFVNEFNQTKQWMGDFTNKAQLASDQFLTAVSESFPQEKKND